MDFLPSFSQILNALNPEERAAIIQATYFTLEACVESGDHILLASIEDAEDGGDYRLHIGLPDRPDMRSALIFDSLPDAVFALTTIKNSLPNIRLWLDTMQVRAEIKGDDMWVGLLDARASMDPSDEECPWVQLAFDFACRRRSYAVYGEGDHEEHWMYEDIARFIG